MRSYHGNPHGSFREWNTEGEQPTMDAWFDHGTKCTREYCMEASKREVETPAASNTTN